MTLRVGIFGLISPHQGRNRGGTAVSVVRLANALAARGVRVDVIALAGSFEQPVMDELDPAVRRWPLHRSSRPAVLASLLLYGWRSRPDALISLDTRANTLATRAKRLPGAGFRVIATLRNEVASKIDAAGGGRRRRGVQRMFRRADAVVAVSHGLAREFADVVGTAVDRLEVIHNLVVTDGLSERVEESVSHSWLAADRYAPVVLGVGRLQAQKDFSTLVRAFARLRRRRPLRLVILGEGNEAAGLEQQVRQLGVEDDVDFPGFVSNPLAWMARADVFVLPSRSEAFGMVLVEAMASGCPVVSTDCPSGPREILDHGRYGALVPVGDDESMATEIERVLDHPPARTLLKEGAHRFTAEAGGQRYLELVQAITGAAEV